MELATYCRKLERQLAISPNSAVLCIGEELIIVHHLHHSDLLNEMLKRRGSRTEQDRATATGKHAASMLQACCKCTSACMKCRMFQSGRDRSLCKVRMCLTASTTSPVPASPFVRIMLAPAWDRTEQVRNGFGTGSKKCVNFFERRSAIRWQCCGNAFGNSAQSLTKVAASAPPLHSRTFKAATCRMPQHAAAIFILNVHPRRSSHVDVDPRVNSTSYPFLILSHFLCIFSANVVCSSSIVELWTGRLIGFHQFHPTCYRMPSNVWPRLFLSGILLSSRAQAEAVTRKGP